MTTSLDGTGVGPALAAAALSNAATAYLALSGAAHLQPGEWVLVHGAMGGLASAFPGVARNLGAAGVVGTVRRGKLAETQASALPYDRVVAGEDLAEAVGGQRFDVVVDPVGGELRTAGLQVMAPMGRMPLVGNASGDWRHTVDTNALWRDNLAVLGFAVGSYLPAHPEQAGPAARRALEVIGQGLIDMRTQTLPLAEAAEAHRRVETGSAGGRILLEP